MMHDETDTTPVLGNLNFSFGALWEHDDPGLISATVYTGGGISLFTVETSIEALALDFVEDWPDSSIPADDCQNARALIKVLRDAADRIEGCIK